LSTQAREGIELSRIGLLLVSSTLAFIGIISLLGPSLFWGHVMPAIVFVQPEASIPLAAIHISIIA